ncbi:MAG: catalase family peroxidase [Sinobacteraceae bacterium]|nr:catalase family peroxidase [Nevskiaceae bacterium]
MQSARQLRTAVATSLVTLLIASAAAFAADAPPADQKPLPVALVDVLNKLSGGPHPGFRANHAKGVLVTGTFTPAKTAPSLSKAPHFAASAPIPVLVRFSDTTGVPTIPDASPDASPHGMAIRFKLPDGSSTDIVSISANGFPVGTPEDFLALLTAISQSGPGVAKPTPVDQFVGSHPATLKFVTTPRPAPESFATLAFYGVNAFKFTNAKGVSRYARYQILPVAGEHALAAPEAAKANPNYLMDELPKRLAAGPVKYRLLAQMAKDGDTTNDATAVWPPDRQLIELGVITLTATEKDQVQKTLLYNPLLLPSGIEASADPILLARPPAYAVSFSRRQQ